MILEKKKWMCYTYFSKDPHFAWRTVHLFSPAKKKIPGMITVPCPTMKASIIENDFLKTWSSSTRTKINRAENDALELKRGKELLPDILDLFRATAIHKKLRGHYPEDFNSRPWICCSAVIAGNKILAGHVWLIDEEEKRSLLFVNASAHHDPEIDPSLTARAHYYLLWQDGMYLRNNGIDCLDLHGYDPDLKDPALTGVYRWKEGTRGEKEELFHYYPFWFYWFVKLRQNFS